MAWVRALLTPADLAHVAKGQTSCAAEATERHRLNERKDVSVKGTQIGELAMPFVPFASLGLPRDVRGGASFACHPTMSRIVG